MQAFWSSLPTSRTTMPPCGAACCSTSTSARAWEACSPCAPCCVMLRRSKADVGECEGGRQGGREGRRSAWGQAIGLAGWRSLTLHGMQHPHPPDDCLLLLPLTMPCLCPCLSPACSARAAAAPLHPGGPLGGPLLSGDAVLPAEQARLLRRRLPADAAPGSSGRQRKRGVGDREFAAFGAAALRLQLYADCWPITDNLHNSRISQS